MALTDPTQRTIVNRLQGGFPLTHEPFTDAGAELGLTGNELIEGVQRLLADGRISRFGPLWNAEGLGGEVCLCAMEVPAERFEAVAGLVNAHPEVAHNYERSHSLNMWFVLSSDRPERIAETVEAIQIETGLKVYPMPKMHEFFVGFRVEV